MEKLQAILKLFYVHGGVEQMSTCIDVLENQGSQYEKRNTGRNVVVDWNWKCQFKLNLKIKIT